MQVLTKTQVSILGNKSDVVNLFTELDISFNSVEGKTVEQLKDLVEDKYQQKRNALSYEWEELKSKGDNQGAELKGNYNIAFDKRYKYFLNTIDNINYTPRVIDESQKSKPKNYKRLITGVVFSLLAIGFISFFAVLYFQTKEKLDNLLEARETKGKEKGKEEATIVLNNMFKIKEDSLKQANQNEQEALESKFKNDKDGLIKEQKKLLDKKESEFAITRKELNDAKTTIVKQNSDNSQKTNEIITLKNLNSKLSDEIKKQKIVTVHDTVFQTSQQKNKEINNNDLNYFEKLVQMKNNGEIKSFEVSISEKKYDKNSSEDETVKTNVDKIKDAINKKGKR